tara:strand:+ start:32 stop:967 length:936 start_codon:yes stop_codon:yes gene_type:complete
MTDLNTCYSNDCKNINDDIKSILEKITNSQTEEQTQLSILKDNDGSGYNITQQQMKGFIDDINKITEDRIKMYDALLKENVSEAVNSIGGIDDFNNSGTSSGAGTSGAGTSGAGTSGAGNTENNLNNQKDKLNKNLKKIEINSYYSKTYDAHRILLKSVFIYLAIILVLLYLGKFFPVIPQVVINSLIAVIIIVAVFNTVRKLYDMGKRTPNNFDEIDWLWSPDMIFKSGMPSNNKDKYGATNLQDLYKRDCKGANCCDIGTEFDPATGKCKITSGQESFQNAFPMKSCGRRLPTGSNTTFTGFNQSEIRF